VVSVKAAGTASATGIGDDDLRADLDGLGLEELGAVREVDVEEVDLAVYRRDPAGGVHMHAGVPHVARLHALFPETAEDELDSERRGEGEEAAEDRPRRLVVHVLGNVQLAGLGTEVGETLGEHDELRPVVGPPPNHALRAVTVGLDVPRRCHLHDSHLRPHGPEIPRPRGPSGQKLKRRMETFIKSPMPIMIVSTLEPP